MALDQMNSSDMESAINIKGQATIPKTIREHLGLKAGDRVKFFLHPDGSVVLLPKLPAGALRGMLNHRRRRPVTIDEMNKAGCRRRFWLQASDETALIGVDNDLAKGLSPLISHFTAKSV